MDSNSQIKIGAIASYIGIIVNLLAGFLYIPWVVSQIGQSDYGLYTLAMSVINFFLFDFGMSGAIARYISVYRQKNEEYKIPRLLGTILKIYLLIDIIIAAALVFIYLNINGIFIELTPAEIEKFKVVFLIIGGFSLFSFPLVPVNGIFSAYERFAALKFFTIAAKLATIASVVVSMLLGYGLYALVLTNTLFQLTVKIIQYIYISKKEKIRIDLKFWDYNLFKEIMTFSVWMAIINIAQRFIININPSIIGALSGAVQVSVFSVGASLEGYTWTFANALNGLFLPKVTRLSLGENPTENISDLMLKVGRIQLMIVGAIICGFASMGQEFILHWMGEAFKDSYYVALFLILPGIVTFTQEIAVNYLIAINEVKWRVIDFVGTAVVSVILSVILTPKFGAVGAAFSAFVGIVLGHVILMNIFYHKKFNLNVFRLFKECHLKMLPCMIFAIIMGILFSRYIYTPNLLLFFVKAAVWCVIYAVSVWFFFMNDSEKQLVVGILNKFGLKISLK